ncbi:HAMP domain-containing sensor histidine kinase [Nakamurella multipartita]|jgi:signal transduction histidine kinase|uniref:histidine kinase n=1 Tax=Nakamurella multipartita (strain ATCC 700099 / DSM 44233 / CIP 104796 / JCM 9543 / NBRC 105858 / Y-104) TaxID=479431 RepID=C8X7U5_NAKMY|nr:HAMP domain-containing sensor histidine kinase [Nakamurella multipartita]ACV80948.1 histidine kinase [Nakamurella multipartita DSM 44233]
MTESATTDRLTGSSQPPPRNETPEQDRPVRTGSLRARVVVSVLVLLAIILVLLGVVVTTMLGTSLRDDLRQRLQDRAGYAVVLQQQGVTGQTLADQMSGGGIFSTFTAGGQEYVGRPDAAPQEQTPPTAPTPGNPPGGAPPLPQPAVEPEVAFTESAGQLTAQVTLPGGTLQLQASENDIERTLSTLRTIEIVAGVTALVITGLVLIRLVAVALRPLDRMASLARRIGAGTRGRRLRPTKPTTDLGRTAVAFDEMLDALETAEATAQQAQERMRRFLADASHDLRTPLAGIIAGSDALLRADFDELDRAEREQRLVAIVRQSRQAARLVDDLLLMARIDNHAANHPANPAANPETRSESVDLVEVVRQQVDAVALRRPDLRIGLRPVAENVSVRIDPDEVGRALANLLENAAQASPSGGQVTATVAVAPGPSGAHAYVTVQDDGPGVPDDQRDRIFERFVRLSTDRGGGGSGLGLPIARAIARRAGGDVVCRPPAAGVGARFELSLPLAGQ